MKLIECSVSNLLSLTHWWNWQSSMTTTGFPERDVSASVFPEIPPRPFASITILSLMPNLHSGIPDKNDFITTLPATWADNTCPCGDMSKLTYSKTSRNNSLRRYLMPSRRHPICPVTWDVICACSSFVADLIPCCVMNVFSTPVSEFWGYPKSRISDNDLN